MTKTIKIICVGANLETLNVLRIFIKNSILINGLITVPEKEEKKGSDYVNLTSFARENDIPLIRTLDINSQETKQALMDLMPDYIFILGWSQLFDQELIEIPNGFIVGSHPSRLPYGAGRAPVPWSILEELEQSSVTLFKVTKDVDAGGILLQKDFDIPLGVDAELLYSIVSDNLATSFLQIYTDIRNNSIVETPQKIENRTVRAKRTISDGYIDFNKTAREIDLLIRAVTSPFPGAFCFYEGKKVIIWKSELSTNCIYKGVPGQILKKLNDKYLVQCGDVAIWLRELAIEGQIPKMSDFILGRIFGFNPYLEIQQLKEQLLGLKKALKDNDII